MKIVRGDNMTTKELEQQLNLSHGTIWNHIRLGNIEKAKEKHGQSLWWSDDEVDIVSEFFREGKR
jgi:hypothetical protein